MAMIITVLFAFLLFESFGYLIHFLAHKNWTGLLYKHHLNHHIIYISSTEDKNTFSKPKYERFFWQSFTPWVAGPFALVLFSAYWLLPFYLFVTFAITIILNTIALDYCHEAFHVEGHWLSKYPSFRIRRKLHWYHHRNTKTNLGIIFYFMDKIFKTLKKT